MSITELQIKWHYGTRIPQRKGDYDASGNLIYQGFADSGIATSQARWLIIKHAYDASNNWTGSQTAFNAIWDNRTTTTYA
jgi:hypothetical protein